MMINPPFSLICRMRECSNALLDGIAGPLSDEQKELVRVMYSNCDETAYQVESMLELIPQFPLTRNNLMHDLNCSLTPIIGYGELIHSGVTGPITAEQRAALQTILLLARRVQDWAYAVCDPSPGG